MSIKSTEKIKRTDAIDALIRWEIEDLVKRTRHLSYAKYDGYDNEKLGDLMDERVADQFTNYWVVDDADYNNEKW